MLTRSPNLADGLEDLLQQGELVWRKRITGDEFSRILVAAHRNRVTHKGELVVDDVALLREAIPQRDVSRFSLGQQTLADHIIGI